VREVVRYCQAAELPLIVRVPSQHRHHISRALDAGAEGVMVPIVVVGGAGQGGARGRQVLARRHARRGARASPTSASRCGASPLLDRFAEQNRRTVIILQVEDPRGAEAPTRSPPCPASTALWLGHNDLSVAMTSPARSTTRCS
jgi:2-dehydro-3-deoxyglucarate aldolase/4-hydroxy-2-oxoheptanedioate aldolase